ncbi:MAG TPA: hypothetical protein PKN32_11110 [Bacteroidales bacterium]|nr:hypothetical protein [Bacteroidales bacterium]
MKKLVYLIAALLIIAMVIFTGCEKDKLRRSVEGTHEATLVMGTHSYPCDMIITYNETDLIYTITLTDGQVSIRPDIVLTGIANEDVIDIQPKTNGYQGICNVYGGTLQVVSRKIVLEFDACGLEFSANEI